MVIITPYACKTVPENNWDQPEASSDALALFPDTFTTTGRHHNSTKATPEAHAVTCISLAAIHPCRNWSYC